MSAPWSHYEINFGDGAFDSLKGQVPPSYFDCIRANLIALANDPTGLSRRCPHPYPGTKVFDFTCDGEGHGFMFRVHFFFEHGETHIQVFDIVAAANW